MYELLVPKHAKKTIEMALTFKRMRLQEDLATKDFSDAYTLEKVAELREVEKTIKLVFQNWVNKEV